MIIKAFPHGKGKGKGPVDYVIAKNFQCRKELPPVVLRGDQNITRRLIDDTGLQGRTWKFCAGVLSWHPDDKITPEMERQVMDSFEQLAFAGLEPDAYNILWVRHEHANHHELHFVIPRMELTTGKAFNPLPPGWQKDFDVLRDLFNEREQWARPDDPARARTRQPGNTGLVDARRKRFGLTPKEDPREVVHGFVEERIAQGFIQNRHDVILSLREVGLEITRAGKHYITFVLPENGKKYRLKGGVYDESWSAQRTAAIQAEARQERGRTASEARIGILEQKLERIIAKRANYNRRRYSAEKRKNCLEVRREVKRNRVQSDELKPSITQGLDTKLFDRKCNSNRRDGRHMGDYVHSQQPSCQPAIPNRDFGGTQSQNRTNFVCAPKKDLGDFVSGKQTGEIPGPQSFSNTEPRVDNGQTSSMEIGVNNDRVRTAPHGQLGKTGGYAERRAENNNLQFNGFKKPSCDIGETCSVLGATLQRIRGDIAKFTLSKNRKIKKERTRGLSR